MITRLGFAVIAHADADILLVDEVLSVGDVGFQAKCIATMREFLARGATLLLASHDVDLVRSLCTRVLWLDRGSLGGDGNPDEIIRRYEECTQFQSS